MPNEFALAIEDIERHFILCGCLEIVVDHRAGGRVVADGLAAIKLLRVVKTERHLRLIKDCVRCG